MTCGGVSIYYSAQSTYIIPLLLDTDSGRSHFFFSHSDFYVTYSDKDIKTFNKTNKKSYTQKITANNHTQKQSSVNKH